MYTSISLDLVLLMLIHDSECEPFNKLRQDSSFQSDKNKL